MYDCNMKQFENKFTDNKFYRYRQIAKTQTFKQEFQMNLEKSLNFKRDDFKMKTNLNSRVEF